MSSKMRRLHSPKAPEIYSYRSAELMRPTNGPGIAEKAGSIAMVLLSLLSVQQNLPKIVNTVTTYIEHEQQAVSNAEDTIELYDGASVAVVGFDMHEKHVTDIADDIEEKFNDMSDGIITVDTDVIIPTVEALRLYDKTNPDDCVDKGDVTKYGSYLAELAMPELKEYDKIIALNAEPACQDNIAGVASTFGNRYSEVFNTMGSWSAIQSNNGEQEVITEGENGTQFISYIGSPVSTGVHELYHLFGLGHMGVLSTKAEARGDIELLKTYTEAPTSIDFDIRKAITQKNYSEYGNPGVMGQGLMEYSEELSTIEKFIVEWPQRKLNKDTEISTHSLNGESVVFNIDNADSAVAAYRFENSVEMKGYEYTYGFDRIVFVPQITNPDFEGAPTTSVDAYLMDGGNNIAELGEIVNVNAQNTTYTIHLDDEALTIVIDYDKNEISIKKAD